jgi:hypothetical protein
VDQPARPEAGSDPRISVRRARPVMTSDAVSVDGGHSSLTPSEQFADRLDRVVAEADIRNPSRPPRSLPCQKHPYTQAGP